MSYLEIYLEEVKDLLRPGGDDEIHIREDDKGNTIVQGKVGQHYRTNYKVEKI